MTALSLPAHALYWGRSPQWQPHIREFAQLPTTTRLVLVAWDDATPQVMTALRQRLPQARLMALCPSHTGGDGVQAALQRGFDDVALGDAHAQAQLQILGRLWESEERVRLHAADDVDLLALVQEVAAKPGLSDVLRTTVLRLGRLFSIRRVGVVLLQPNGEVGFLVTSAAGQELDNVMIRVSDHRELVEVLQRRVPVVISEQLAQVLSDAVPNDGTPRPPRSAALFPLLRRDQAVGALFLRGDATMAPPGDRLMQIGTFIAAVTCVALSHAMEQDTLLSAQRQLLRDQETAQAEILSLRQFSDVFEKALDGVLIASPEGTIRYANPSACAMLQRKAEQLRGATLYSLLSSHSMGLAKRAFAGDAVGDAYGYVDLLVGEEAGAETVISVAIRPLMEDGGVLVTFRDVTELREIENELRHTKEVLENLIQSCTDAVVATNVDGRIILFNRAAETLLNYRAREVMGRKGWDMVFARGEGEELLRRLHSEGHGGRGRLQMRTDLLDAQGAPIAVNVSASCVYEGAREVAVVGVFTDLRERLKTEERLTQVQRRVRVLEEQSHVMQQVAQGVHDLAQPLTAMMGYAPMLEQADNAKAIAVIVREMRRAVVLIKHLRQLTAPEAHEPFEV